MGVAESILVAVSLCADCFAVSLCSSVTLKEIRRKQLSLVALSFAVIQSSFLLAGWLFGSFLAGFVERIAHIIAFALLAYVGGSMLVEGIRGEENARDLSSLRNIIVGGVATSIDALAVGVSQSVAGQVWSGFVPLLVSVAVVTAVSVVAGINGGKVIGGRFGRWAEIAGGTVLAVIGIGMLF